MLPKTIENYGGPYENAETVANPQTEMDADFGNALLEDVAQLTRMGPKARVSFVPVATAAPVAVVVESHRSIWGSSDTQKPTIAKTATGRYTITWPATQVDGNGETETLAFTEAQTQLRSTLGYAGPPPVVQTVSANAVSVIVLDSVLVDSDIGGAGSIVVWAE